MRCIISRNGPYVRGHAVFFFRIEFQRCLKYTLKIDLIICIFHEINIKHPFTKIKTNKLISTTHNIFIYVFKRMTQDIIKYHL